MNHVSAFLETISTTQDTITIYRGHADAALFKLKPSIGRHFTGSWNKVVEREKKSLDEFKKRAIPYLRYTPKLDIDWLCLMQHYGCSTRLIDFTSNPLVALFFAADPLFKMDGEVIIANYASYEEVSNEELFKRTCDFAYSPSHITERIIGQFASFVYSSNPNQPIKTNTSVKNYPVKKELKHLIRSELMTLGINQSTLFPGLDGICKDINDSLVLDLMLEDI